MGLGCTGAVLHREEAVGWRGGGRSEVGEWSGARWEYGAGWRVEWGRGGRVEWGGWVRE